MAQLDELATLALECRDELTQLRDQIEELAALVPAPVISAISALQLGERDILVLKTAHRISTEIAERIRNHLSERLGVTRILVLDNEIELSIVRHGDDVQYTRPNPIAQAIGISTDGIPVNPGVKQ